MRFVLVAVVLAGCGEAEVDFADQGVVCVGGIGEPVNLIADRPLALQVALANDGHCDANVLDTETTCDWDGGSNIDVHASARLLPLSADASCLTLVNARCDTEPLPAGTYTVHYAGKTVSVDLPSTATSACTGDWLPGA